MNDPAQPSSRLSRWAVVVAFAIVYLSWGTTYLAIKVGVEHLPWALFGGVRLTLAGLILFGFFALRGERLCVPRRELWGTALSGVCFFVGGNGLITIGEKTVDSSVAAILVATTPLWMALLDYFWPWGDRLTVRGWLGLLVGLAGVGVLLAPSLQQLVLKSSVEYDLGALLVLSSAFCWAIGSLVSRYQHRSGSAAITAAYQMVIGGGALTLIGVGLGEIGELTPESFVFEGVFAFFYLLVIGSLVGFVAYTFLLGRVSAALAGTYAYVNPAVAILVGWLVRDEPITRWLLAGMVVILAGVALVRGGGVHKRILETTITPEPGRNGPLVEEDAKSRAAAENL